MDMQNPFKPMHVSATHEDFVGNNGIGRYLLLPGSDGRAKGIAEGFENLEVRHHPRGHNVYLGTLNHKGQKLDVASVSSGMGCPSMEIILHELFNLGARRFLRVGTAGSLQPQQVKLGDLVNVQASVRDENTTTHYAPLSVPAVASIEVILSVLKAAEKLKLTDVIHTGVVHCKSSFYAREFSAGPQASENDAFLALLTECDVLASEMETAALFIQSQIYNHQLMQQGTGPAFRVLSGAILGILAIPPDLFITKEEEKATTEKLLQLAFESIKSLAEIDFSSASGIKNQAFRQYAGVS